MRTRLLLEGADIQQLLGRVRAEHGPGARIVSAERAPAGPMSGERFALTIEIDDPPSAATLELDADALLALADAQQDRLQPESLQPDGLQQEPAAEPFAGATFAEVLTSLGAQPATAAAPSPVTPTPAMTPPVAPPPLTTPTPTPTPTAAPPPAPPATVRPYRPPADEEDLELRGALLGLGLPRWLAQRVAGSDGYPAIFHALSALPPAPAPPAAPGQILVVFGELSAALAVAAAVSQALRLNPDDIAVARSWTPLAPSGDRPQVVVVDAADPGTDVETFEPAAIWAVVDATRKTADTARQLRALPRVDALAVRGATATADPASVLQLDIPVALLDERPATSHEWAALLCRRLVDGETDSEAGA